jgi:hypothetical protein
MKKTRSAVTYSGINFYRLDNDVNGNPRYVCHFLNFIKQGEACYDIASGYIIALKRSRVLGGRKFHNKQFGGGIVLQSFNLQETAEKIVNIKNN